METKLRILILEDSVDDVELIEHQLKKGEFSFVSRVVECRDGFEKALAEFKPDVILSDHSLPMFDSMLALQMFHSYRKIFHPAAVFILVTGTVSEEFAVQIMRNGADDYILKDRLKRLSAAILNAWEKNRLKEQRRKEQEEKLYLFDILQRSLHEIYLINPEDFHFEYVNQEAVKNLGYSLDELHHMTPGDIIDTFNETQFRQVIKLAGERMKGLLLERNAKRKNGTSYPVQVHVQVVGSGNTRRILANVLDITETKELEEQKEWTSFIQDSFNYQRDLQQSLELVLEKICNSCRCVAAEIYSREFDELGSELLASYDKDANPKTDFGKQMAEKVYESRTVQHHEFSTDEDKEGNRSTVNNIRSAVAMPIELGEEIIAVLVGFLDQDEADDHKFSVLSEEVRNKLAENIKRKKTEEELQKIFDFTPDILLVLGKDGYIRKVNPALQKTLGYSAEQMLSTCFEHLVHPDDQHVLEAWRKKDLKRNEIAHYESRWITSKGEYKWFSWAVTPYRKGELHFAVGRDMTETKKQLNAIKNQNRKLSEIAWEQSHVVRAPLTRLLACVEFLEENKAEPNDILSNVKRSAYEIDKIIKDIIFKSGKVEFNGKG